VYARVVLNYFKATSQSDGILLEWETSSETNSSGFYILRSTNPDLNYTRINIYFLSDSEAGEGAYYSFLDDELIPGFVYYYKLEAIDLDGSREFFGPVSAGFMLAAPTITPTPARTEKTQTRTPTPSGRATSTSPGIITPTQTETGKPQMTTTPFTPTISETVSDQPTVTPTLEPLPEFEYLFPAPTATSIVSPTPVISPMPIESELPVASQSRHLTTRYVILIGIILFLWIFLFVFWVLIVRKLSQSALIIEDSE
jgi:hypothetical protein